MKKIQLFGGTLDVLRYDQYGDYDSWVEEISKQLDKDPTEILFTTSDDDSEFCEAIFNKMFRDNNFERLEMLDFGFTAKYEFNGCMMIVSYESGLQVVHFRKEDLNVIQQGYDSM